MTVVENRATQETFQSLNLWFFRPQKNKNEYMEMTEKIYLETLKNVLGRSVLHYQYYLKCGVISNTIIFFRCLKVNFVFQVFQI